MRLCDWFQYSDRENSPYNPTASTTITVDRFWQNELRIGSAHIGNPELDPIFELIGIPTVQETPRLAWNLCVNAVENCLHLNQWVSVASESRHCSKLDLLM